MSGSEPADPTVNPLDSSEALQPPFHPEQNGPRPLLPGDSAVTRAEKIEGARIGSENGDFDQPPAKRQKVDSQLSLPREKGVAPIKAEYLINKSSSRLYSSIGEDASGSREDARDSRDNRRQEKPKGQNVSRSFGSSRDALQLCQSRSHNPEFSPADCKFGANCKFEHDLRRYLDQGKRADLDTFGGQCPVLDARGKCNSGWRCRFASTHSTERTTDDGRKELILTYDSNPETSGATVDASEDGPGVVNVVPIGEKIKLRKKHVKTPKSDAYSDYLNKLGSETESWNHGRKENPANGGAPPNGKDAKGENRSQYTEPPFLPSEKRRIYYGPETPVLAPLTTQGNLPFRRLCVELGAQLTWSEMAMGLPLIQGEKSEWALMKAHVSELSPPKYDPSRNIVYDNQKDLKFGAQIAGNKPWMALKATEILTSLCPHLRAIDLNCGCPIDLVYRQGAGSALLDSPSKLEKILRGMNAVSGEVPITVKIRMGTKDNKPTAERLVERLAWGGPEAMETNLGPAGVAAVTLHGRSRQQRYTKTADWGYISQCASIIQQYNSERDKRTDTSQGPDTRDLSAQGDGRLFFLGNGDCFSHTDYYEHIDHAKVDSVMVARGALIKPWIFEEIEKGQHLDKSSTERLRYIEQFARYGLETWGSDEMGIGTTRRFLLEWLSFACRYVPIGILEHLPPHIQDRPPAYRGRDELETLLSSDNYKDWIKISEMFLGPAHPDFKFEPKHKSNAYEVEG